MLVGGKIEARPSAELVAADAAFEHVIPDPTGENVVPDPRRRGCRFPAAAHQPIVALQSDQRIVAGVTGEDIVRAVAADRIVAAATDGILDEPARIAFELQGIEDVAAGVDVIGDAQMGERPLWRLDQPPGARSISRSVV